MRNPYRKWRGWQRREAIEREFGKPFRDVLYDLYMKENLSMPEMAKRLGYSHTMNILYWMRKFGIETKETRVQIDLSSETSVAYILGVILGDGNVCQGKVQLTTVDRPFAEEVGKYLESMGMHTTITYVKKDNPKWRDIYHLAGYATAFEEWYVSLGNSDIEFAVMKNRATRKAFLRGFYESEGSCRTHLVNGKWPETHVTFTNTNPWIVDLTTNALKAEGCNFTASWYSQTYGPTSSQNGKKQAYAKIRINGGEKGKEAFVRWLNPVIKRWEDRLTKLR